MKPIFSIGSKKETVYAEPRKSSRVLRSSKEWYGTAACVVRHDLADPRMKKEDYGAGLEEKIDEGNFIDEVLDKVFEYGRLVSYVKKKEIRVNNKELQHWVKLLVYKGPQEIFFIDAGQSPPDKLYALSENASLAVDSLTRVDVRMILSLYSVDEDKYREIASSL